MIVTRLSAIALDFHRHKAHHSDESQQMESHQIKSVRGMLWAERLVSAGSGNVLTARDCKYRHALPPGYVLKSQMKVRSRAFCRKASSASFRFKAVQASCLMSCTQKRVSSCDSVMQELLAEEAANRKDIEDVIEEERAKVDAKTQITQDVFLQWRQKNKDDKVKQQEAVEADRKKKGIMTGREIFAQVLTIMSDSSHQGRLKRLFAVRGDPLHHDSNKGDLTPTNPSTELTAK